MSIKYNPDGLTETAEELSRLMKVQILRAAIENNKPYTTTTRQGRRKIVDVRLKAQNPILIDKVPVWCNFEVS